MSRTQIPIGLRVPPHLADWLRQQAAENQRSVANQTAWVLDQFRKQQADKPAAQPP